MTSLFNNITLMHALYILQTSKHQVLHI